MKKPISLQFLNNQNGAALIMVMALSVIIGIMGLGLISAINFHHFNSIKMEVEEQSYYTAEAGVYDGKTFIIDYVVTHPPEKKPDTTPVQVFEDYQTIQNRSDLTFDYQIIVTKVGNDYLIESFGTVVKNSLTKTTKISTMVIPHATTVTSGRGKNKTITYVVDSFNINSWKVEH